MICLLKQIDDKVTENCAPTLSKQTETQIPQRESQFPFPITNCSHLRLYYILKTDYFSHKPEILCLATHSTNI